MTSSSSGRKPVIYLDTNVLHYMAHYLRLAKDQGLPPFGGQYDDASLLDHLTGPGPSGKHCSDAIAKHLRKGWRALRYLQLRALEESRIMTSPATWAELRHGQQESRAQGQLYESGMTFRMRQRLSVKEKDIQELLMTGGFRETNRCLRDDQSRVEDVVGQSLDYARPEDLPSILAVASLLQGRVYLDLLDCVVLADALYQEADELITGDGWLCEVTNHICKPSLVYWKRVRGVLRRRIASDRQIEPGELHLPEAKRPENLSEELPQPQEA